MPENLDTSSGQPDKSPSTSADAESNATPEITAEAPEGSRKPMRTRDVGVFEASLSDYLTADDTNSLTTSQVNHRVSAGRTRGWMAYVVFVVLVLMALLVRFAIFNTPQATKTGSRAASSSTLAPDATATPVPGATDTPLPGITPNATIPVSTGGGPVPTAGPEMPFTVTAAEISSGPTTYDGECLPPETMPVSVNGAVYVPGTTPGGTITYRWRFSDGTITPTQSVLIGPTNRPLYYGAANDQLIEGQWAIDPTIADGSRKWAEFEVLTPSHLLSPPTYFWFKCEFSIHTATSAVSGGYGGTSPRYDCAAGGDQTFIFTGAIEVFPDPHSHTVTYHWQRSDGTQSPDMSVTLAPGQYSAGIQPDTIVVSYAQAVANFKQYGTQTMWEKVVVTSSPGIQSYLALYSPWCQT